MFPSLQIGDIATDSSGVAIVGRAAGERGCEGQGEVVLGGLGAGLV